MTATYPALVPANCCFINIQTKDWMFWIIRVGKGSKFFLTRATALSYYPSSYNAEKNIPGSDLCLAWLQRFPRPEARFPLAVNPQNLCLCPARNQNGSWFCCFYIEESAVSRVRKLKRPKPKSFSHGKSIAVTLKCQRRNACLNRALPRNCVVFHCFGREKLAYLMRRYAVRFSQTTSIKMWIRSETTASTSPETGLAWHHSCREGWRTCCACTAASRIGTLPVQCDPSSIRRSCATEVCNTYCWVFSLHAKRKDFGSKIWKYLCSLRNVVRHNCNVRHIIFSFQRRFLALCTRAFCQGKGRCLPPSGVARRKAN